MRQRQRERGAAREVSLGRSLARERILTLTREVGEENYFRFADGSVVKHVAELAACLDQVPPDVFRRHVNDLCHELADWVGDVFGDPVLAGRMRGVKEPRYLQLELYRYLSGRDPDSTI